MPLPRLHPLDNEAAVVLLIDIIDLALAALAADLAHRHHPLADDGDQRLPSSWLATVIDAHAGALRAALATYNTARLFEQDERLF